MYLMYVDECGDCGMGPGSSRFFILSAIVVHESYWTEVMTRFAEQRFRFRELYGFDMSLELHAGQMLGRTGKKYSKFGKNDRASMLRQAIALESTIDALRIINVVNDKQQKHHGYDVMAATWDVLINRFENTIERGNFPHPKGSEHDSGIIIADETDMKKLRELIRRMRHGNYVPSKIQHGSQVRHDLIYVIEDVLHKQSDTSLLIQMCDANSYFLKQTLEPNTSVSKHGVKNLFYKLEPVLLKQACYSDPLGIVRL